jgi:hypothetical protein
MPKEFLDNLILSVKKYYVKLLQKAIKLLMKLLSIQFGKSFKRTLLML